MKNILLVFLNNLKDIEGLNKIIDEFDKRGYKMYLYDSIKDTDFDFTELPDIIQFYKNQFKNINKIVILSNLKDLILSWYRCYNSIIDDFIYFLDNEENQFFSIEDRHYMFYSNLCGFNGIEKETVSGKIYTNINFNNYHKLIDFLIRNNNFRHFDSFENFDFIYGGEKPKKNVNKKYILNKYEYNFEFFNARNIEKINMFISNKQELINTDNLIIEVCKNVFIIPYITVLFHKTDEQIYTNLLLAIYKYLKNVDKQKQEEVFDRLFTYINMKDIDFKERIYISSLLVMIHNGNAKLTEFMMKTLLEDEKYIDYHYEIVSNILFYCSNENLNEHFNYYMNLRDEVGKIANWVSREMNGKISKKNNGDKKIAILVDQLLSIKHSPTKLMLDYAKNIKKYYPEYEVMIFVEDNLVCSNVNKLIPYLFSSEISQSCNKEHINYLGNEDIKIYYCDATKTKKDRTIEILNEINLFLPQVILSNSDISIMADLLYDTYPIIYMSMGGDYFLNRAHMYFCLNKERVIESNSKYKLLNEDIVYEFKYGLEFSNPTKIIKREDLNIDENDFVMISVGNRLNAEIDEEFIDYIMSFILQNQNVRWIIVGSKEINYLINKYNSFIADKIILIKYESDLPGLYRICNVYVNPRRKGGGISIAMAMHEGLPIVLTKDSTDGAVYTGIENVSGDSLQEYIDDLKRIYNDENYANKKRLISMNRIKEFKVETNIDFLMQKINTLKN